MFLDYINGQHPNIKFTAEIKSGDSLPFLDVLVSHDETNYTTNLYGKMTFTGLYSDFSCLSLVKYKSNLTLMSYF